MALKDYEANPLAVFNMRKMDFCPKHFQSITFSLICDERVILDWMYENTDGRFFLGRDHSGNMVVGFENHSESTYFALMLVDINKPKFS